MKAYEADGRLLIRHGVRLPKTPDMVLHFFVMSKFNFLEI